LFLGENLDRWCVIPFQKEICFFRVINDWSYELRAVFSLLSWERWYRSLHFSRKKNQNRQALVNYSRTTELGLQKQYNYQARLQVSSFGRYSSVMFEKANIIILPHTIEYLGNLQPTILDIKKKKIWRVTNSNRQYSTSSQHI
jgi:hypothetical protein